MCLLNTNRSSGCFRYRAHTHPLNKIHRPPHSFILSSYISLHLSTQPPTHLVKSRGPPPLGGVEPRGEHSLVGHSFVCAAFMELKTAQPLTSNTPPGPYFSIGGDAWRGEWTFVCMFKHPTQREGQSVSRKKTLAYLLPLLNPGSVDRHRLPEPPSPTGQAQV